MADLAVEHHRRIELVADTVAAEVRAEARKVDVDNVDAWWRSRGRTVERAVATGNRVTAQLGVRYLAQSAILNGFELNPVAVAMDAARLVTALRVTGPVAFKQAVNNTGSVDAARGIMADRLTGSARRLTLAGSRDTVFAAADSTPGIIGYRRVAEANACKFCKMLESRGAVFLSKESASVVVGGGGRARGTRKLGRAFHDDCNCRIEELWDDETARPVTPPPAAAADAGGRPPPRTPPTPTPAAVPPDPPRRAPAKKAAAKKAAAKRPGRRLNAGDLTEDQGRQIAASAAQATRGEITMAQHRKFVRDLTNTDSRGRPRTGPGLASPKPKPRAAKKAPAKKAAPLPPKPKPPPRSEPKVRKVDPSRPRRLNAGDLTEDQGRQIVEGAARMQRGEITPADYRKFVRDLTNTDSRGRPRRPK